MSPPTPIRDLGQLIVTIRGRRVIFDSDLASLYQVATKRLNEQVTRNLDRFPEEFAFVIERKELINLKSQITTSSSALPRF